MGQRTRAALVGLCLALSVSCGPSEREVRRVAPQVLEKYGFQEIQLQGTGLWGQASCPRGYQGIDALATLSGVRYSVSVCWSGRPPNQAIAVIRRPAPR